jgi:hypothetical protein
MAAVFAAVLALVALPALSHSAQATVPTLASTPQAKSPPPYPPPTVGKGRVNKTTVRAGQCVVFSGGGFHPRAILSIRDQGVQVTKMRANKKGDFQVKVCFSTSARLGHHTICARGRGANLAGREVCAVVTVVGAERVRPNGYGDLPHTTGPGGFLPFEASTGNWLAALIIAALVAVGGWFALLARRRRRKRPAPA